MSSFEGVTYKCHIVLVGLACWENISADDFFLKIFFPTEKMGFDISCSLAEMSSCPQSGKYLTLYSFVAVLVRFLLRWARFPLCDKNNNKKKLVFSEKTNNPPPWSFCFSTAVTLKIRSRSLESYQFFVMFPLYIHENLVRIQPLVHRYWAKKKVCRCYWRQWDPHQDQYVPLPSKVLWRGGWRA